MKNCPFFLLLVLLTAQRVPAQVSINTDGSFPVPAAMLEVKSSTKGFLLPRMTNIEMNAISSPGAGLLVYNTSIKSLFWYDGNDWKKFNTDYLETDPVFQLYPASVITADLINQWNIAFSSRLTSASGTLPLTLRIFDNQLDGFIRTAGPITSGYVTSTNWNTFINKQNLISTGNATSPDMVIHGGTGAIVGNGLNLMVNKANLTSADINISNGTDALIGADTKLTIKKGNLTESGSVVLIISEGSSAVTGTGTTISVKQANSVQSGYISANDWSTFNNKQGTLTSGNLTSTDINVIGGSGAVFGSGTSMTIPKGNLISTDFPVTGGSGVVLGGDVTISANKGTLSANGSTVFTIKSSSGTLNLNGTNIQGKMASGSQSGFLSSADYLTFINKISSKWVTNNSGYPKIFYSSGSVGIGTSTPDPSALLEVKSTTGGFLPPRMTKMQRNSINSPEVGLIIYCTDCQSSENIQIFTGLVWNPLKITVYPN